jgi:hypothetical protein
MSFYKWMEAEAYGKQDLDDLIEAVQRNEAGAIKEAVAFFLAESRGLWHGRARAKICRNFKNRGLSQDVQSVLVEAICQRLTSGRFSQQFKDQLTMAIRFRPDEMHRSATHALASKKYHVRKYAKWVLQKLDRVGYVSEAD